MKNNLKIVLLADKCTDTQLILDELNRGGLLFTLNTICEEVNFLSELDEYNPDLVINGRYSSERALMQPLSSMRTCNYTIPFVLITNDSSEEFALECMKAGADEYVSKNNLARLSGIIESIFYKKEIQHETMIIERLHEKLLDAYLEVEQKNKQITDNINSAKRIQEAMLPNMDALTRVFPRSFICYRPKDIVSGDFYWFAEYQSTFIIVVADCTGHGVSGALISMIGHCLLNSIVNMKGITKPSDIIKTLNRSVRRYLKQDRTCNLTWDGMDVGVCAIDRVNDTLEFAGANRSLYYLCNDEIEILRGNKNSVGGNVTEAMTDFYNHELTFSPGGTIYLATDGFVDQFGGNSDKRISTKRMLNWLQSVNSLPMEDQEKILNQLFDDWKGNNEQTDDVLLIGIRLKQPDLMRIYYDVAIETFTQQKNEYYEIPVTTVFARTQPAY